MNKTLKVTGGVALASGAALAAYKAGRLIQFIRFFNSFVFPVPGKGIYLFAKFDWDGDYEEAMEHLFGAIQGTYDAHETYDEIDNLNDMYYDGEE